MNWSELDTYRHKGMRRELVEIVKAKGISDAKVLEAINRVPRHLFMGLDNIFDVRAYEDKAFPIGEGQTISQPYTVAYQTQLLEVVPDDKVLEIGTGSGYQAAILAELGAKVYTIERQRKLYDRTRDLLNDIGYKQIRMFFGDGYEGLETFEPYDKIIITAAAPLVPEKLLKQLIVGGQMVLPLNINGSTKMVRITRHDENDYGQEVFSDFAFVPMLGGKAF